jgi:hypothetical protein
MPGISIDWAALEAAFENHAPDVRSFLDRTTGGVATILGDGDENDPLVRRVQTRPEDFVLVEPVPSREQYRMMERFIDTVTNASLKERLADSIVGKGAFRRFKDIIGRYPEERKRWFAFRDVLLHRHILDWLKQHKLEVLEMPAWSLELPDKPTPEGESETPVDQSQEAAPVEPLAHAEKERFEAEELKGYLLAWARAHGEEYHYLFGPAAFERLAVDMSQEFSFFRRRS